MHSVTDCPVDGVECDDEEEEVDEEPKGCTEAELLDGSCPEACPCSCLSGTHGKGFLVDTIQEADCDEEPERFCMGAMYAYNFVKHSEMKCVTECLTEDSDSNSDDSADVKHPKSSHSKSGKDKESKSKSGSSSSDDSPDVKHPKKSHSGSSKSKSGEDKDSKSKSGSTSSDSTTVHPKNKPSRSGSSKSGKDKQPRTRSSSSGSKSGSSSSDDNPKVKECSAKEIRSGTCPDQCHCPCSNGFAPGVWVTGADVLTGKPLQLHCMDAVTAYERTRVSDDLLCVDQCPVHDNEEEDDDCEDDKPRNGNSRSESKSYKSKSGSSSNSQDGSCDDCDFSGEEHEDGITVCHRTSSKTNPFVMITIPKAGYDAHMNKYHDCLPGSTVPDSDGNQSVDDDCKLVDHSDSKSGSGSQSGSGSDSSDHPKAKTPSHSKSNTSGSSSGSDSSDHPKVKTPSHSKSSKSGSSSGSTSADEDCDEYGNPIKKSSSKSSKSRSGSGSDSSDHPKVKTPSHSKSNKSGSDSVSSDDKNSSDKENLVDDTDCDEYGNPIKKEGGLRAAGKAHKKRWWG